MLGPHGTNAPSDALDSTPDGVWDGAGVRHAAVRGAGRQPVGYLKLTANRGKKPQRGRRRGAPRNTTIFTGRVLTL